MESKGECPICLSLIVMKDDNLLSIGDDGKVIGYKIHKLECGHLLCESCYLTFRKNAMRFICPVCCHEINDDMRIDVYQERIIANERDLEIQQTLGEENDCNRNNQRCIVIIIFCVIISFIITGVYYGSLLVLS